MTLPMGRVADQVWAIKVKDSGVLAGTVGLLTATTKGAPVHVGCYLHPDSAGQGFATEAVHAVLSLAFEQGFHRVMAHVHPDNRPARNVCERLGMRSLGLDASKHRDPVQVFAALPPHDTAVQSSET